MLIAKDVAKSYPTPRGALTILSGISLTLDRGDAIAVMGPSGSGKSTLLYILGALEPPTSGTVTLDGQDPYTLGERAQAAFRNRHIGFVFQDHSLLPQCSVLENVLTPTLAAPAAEGQRGRGRTPRAGDSRPGRPAGSSRSPSRRVVGRGEAARGRRARADSKPLRAALRRADRQPRSQLRGRRRRSPSRPAQGTADDPGRGDSQSRAGGAVSRPIRDGWRTAEARGSSGDRLNRERRVELPRNPLRHELGRSRSAFPSPDLFGSWELAIGQFHDDLDPPDPSQRQVSLADEPRRHARRGGGRRRCSPARCSSATPCAAAFATSRSDAWDAPTRS